MNTLVDMQFHFKESILLCVWNKTEQNLLKGVFQKTLLMIHQEGHRQVGKHLYLGCDSQAAQHQHSRMTDLSLCDFAICLQTPCFKQLSEKSCNFPFNRAKLGQNLVIQCF